MQTLRGGQRGPKLERKCATEKEERGEGSEFALLSCLPDRHRVPGIGSSFSRGKKKPWSSLLQMNIPKRKAFCKHGQKMHKCSKGADYLIKVSVNENFSTLLDFYFFLFLAWLGPKFYFGRKRKSESAF